MSTKFANLRFLLALGNTKMVVLRDEKDIHHIYTRNTSGHIKSPISAEHVAEALAIPQD